MATVRRPTDSVEQRRPDGHLDVGDVGEINSDGKGLKNVLRRIEQISRL
jgi:hypothetical protein